MNGVKWFFLTKTLQFTISLVIGVGLPVPVYPVFVERKRLITSIDRYHEIPSVFPVGRLDSDILLM